MFSGSSQGCSWKSRRQFGAAEIARRRTAQDFHRENSVGFRQVVKDLIELKLQKVMKWKHSYLACIHFIIKISQRKHKFSAANVQLWLIPSRTAGELIGSGLQDFISDPKKITAAVGGLTALAVGWFAAKHSTGIMQIFLFTLFLQNKITLHMIELSIRQRRGKDFQTWFWKKNLIFSPINF